MTFFAVQKEAPDLREQICQDLVWWKNPQEVEDSELLRRIMNLGTWEMWQWARTTFPVKFFRVQSKAFMLLCFPILLLSNLPTI